MDVHKRYTGLMENRFSFAKQGTYEQNSDYNFLLCAPYHYRVEASMLEYVQRNPEAGLKDLLNHFEKITSEGLAPDDDGEDL